jgi:hypothetical protein
VVKITTQQGIGKKPVAIFVDTREETQQTNAALPIVVLVQDVGLVYSTKNLMLFIAPKPVSLWIITSNTGQELEYKA